MDYLDSKLDEIKERKKEFHFSNRDLISDLITSLSILNEDGFEYSFPHRSMQEYFAAKYISEMETDDKGSVFKLLWSRANKNTIFFFSAYKNFFTIFMELDFVTMIKQFVLPLLIFVHKKISFGHNEIVNSSSDISFVMENFVLVNEEFAAFKEYNNLPFQYSLSINGDNDPKSGLYEAAENTVNHFLTIYNDLLIAVNKIIDDKSTNNAEIIALIPKSL